MHENTVKKNLQSGRTVFGCFSRYANADLTEALCLQGFDFVVLDGEHGTVEPGDCQDMTRAAELRRVTPIVRVPNNHLPAIPRYLDTGVQGVLVPMVNSPAQAEAVVQLAKYPPREQRGLASCRAADFGQGPPLDQYVKFANEQTLIIVQCETTTAVEALPDIVKVDGVDVVFVGPTDLSQSLGRTAQVQHAEVQDTIQRIADIVTASEKVFGLMVGDIEEARSWQRRGARFISVNFESRLSAGCRPFLEAVRTD